MSAHQYLPSIDIAVPGAPRPFLERIAKIAEASGSFKIERHYDALGTLGFDVLNLRYLKPSPHTKVGGQLIARSEIKGRIVVEMRAQAWCPDPLTYDSYCSAARSVIGPLLIAYNREVGTKHRLRIQNPRQLEAKLPPRSAQLFKTFAVLANTSSLHPLDWQRFYDFVRASRNQLYEEELSRLLVKEGFSRSYADRIAEIYSHLCEFKRSR